MTVLSVRNLTVSVAAGDIVSDLSLQVSAGEWLGIIGPNGAGKTTILKAVAGLMPYRGRVGVDRLDLASMAQSERARLVALVPQRPVIPPGMRVIDYVLLGRNPHLRYLASEGASDVEAAVAALASLDALDLADRHLDGLSGGESQRAVLARALAQAAPLLLLDEPTSALDVGHAQHVLALIDGMRHGGGLTVVSAIHDLTLASQFCDRLVLISRGRSVAEGTPREVLTEESIRRHFGASVRVIEDGDDGVVVIPVRDSTHAAEAATMTSGEFDGSNHRRRDRET